jgi:polysaccharide biosynthesis/export protein
MKSVFIKTALRSIFLLSPVLAIGVLSACSTYPAWLPSAGPSTEQVQQTTAAPGSSAIQIVDVTDAVARKLLASQKQSLFSEIFMASAQSGYVIGAGDVVEVSVWEAQAPAPRG